MTIFTYSHLATFCFIGMNTILLLSTLPIMYTIINQYRTADDDGDKAKLFHFILGLIFSMTTFLALLILVIMGVLDLNYANNHSMFHTFWILFAICYALQSYFLLLLLFTRLYVIFLGSVFHLSNKTIKLFKFIFMCAPVTLIFIPFLHYIRGTITWSFAVAALSVFLIFIMTTLICLFLSKLVKVLEKSSNDLDFTSLITKATILGIFSIVFTTCAAILIITRYTIWCEPKYFVIQHICTWFIPLNIYVNFMCIILNYSSFKPHYNMLCVCCHNKCRDIILYIVFRDMKIQSLSKSELILRRGTYAHSVPTKARNSSVATPNRYSLGEPGVLRLSLSDMRSAPTTPATLTVPSSVISPVSPQTLELPELTKLGFNRVHSTSDNTNGSGTPSVILTENINGPITPLDTNVNGSITPLNARRLQTELGGISEGNDENTDAVHQLKLVIHKSSEKCDDYVNMNETL